LVHRFKAESDRISNPSLAEINCWQRKTAIALNRKSIQLAQLEPALRALAKPQENMVVIVNADEKVEHGKIIAVMDRVRRVKEAKLEIATRRP
jgi:biopolymer transport protein ExbD